MNEVKCERVLKEVLRGAGAILRRKSKRTLTIDHKGEVDLVTDADRASERYIRKSLGRAFPDHAFLMEEFGASGVAGDYRWVADPLDGTVNFAHGVPIYNVSIALEEKGRVVMGGVYDPCRDELFFAARGRGATLNGRPIRVSSAARLIDGLAVTGFPYDRKDTRRIVDLVARVLPRTRGLRRLGAAALDLCYVACGRLDIYWEYHLKPWDMAAGALIVEEAGGRVTDFRGRAVTTANPGELLATNGRLHAPMRRLLVG